MCIRVTFAFCRPHCSTMSETEGSNSPKQGAPGEGAVKKVKEGKYLNNKVKKGKYLNSILVE